MKKFLLLTFISALFFSCETTPKEVEKGPAPGYLVAQGGSFFSKQIRQHSFIKNY